MYLSPQYLSIDPKKCATYIYI